MLGPSWAAPSRLSACAWRLGLPVSTAKSFVMASGPGTCRLQRTRATRQQSGVSVVALHQKPRQTFRPWPAKLCVCVNLHASGSHAALKFRLGEHLAIYIQDFDACFERLLQRGRWKEMSCHAFQTRNVGVELNRPLKVLSG